jgi:allantoate deiminase
MILARYLLIFAPKVMTNSELAAKVFQRVETLSQISEDTDRLTRTFCSLAMRRASNLVGCWMSETGMTVSEDAIGNVVGRYPGSGDHSKTFILGSHLDTIRGAGKFDGSLGILIALACVEHLHSHKTRLPFALEVVGFADGDGARYQTTCLGSRALAGTFNELDLKKVDARGVSMADAIRTFGSDPDNIKKAQRDPQQLLGYAEVHIEQGPVLEKKVQPIGIVTAIAGRTRIRARFIGQAGHVGTTPMPLRRDALVAASQFILAVEACSRHYPGLVATVSQVEVLPGGANAIPGEVVLNLDVRHQLDGARGVACASMQETAAEIAQKRGIAVEWNIVHDAQSVPCSRELSDALAKAARTHLVEATELTSGDGHDAAAMGDITPAAMLFIRCAGGITHHPDESVLIGDVEIAIAVMNDFLKLLANQRNPLPAKKRA